MAFRATDGSKAKATELEQILDRWEQRYEWRLLSKTVPRSLIAALLLSLVIGVIGYWRLRLGAEQLALIAAGLCALGGILNLIYTLLFPRKLQERARFFDIEFDLRERISTAFELMHGRIKTHPEIESRQIADALAHARAIDPRERIGLDFRPRELTTMLILLFAVVGMVLLPSIVGEDFLADLPSAAVEAAEEDLRDIIETVAKDTNLDDIDRQELLNALETALERLQEEDISEEEAFAAMSQLSAQLEEMENELGETLDLDQSTLEAAAEALKDFIPPSETDGENVDASPGFPHLEEDLLEALDQMTQDAADMSEAETQSAAEALQAASEALADMSEAMAEQLRSMAEALEAGDSESLQSQLSAAQEQLSQQQTEHQQQQASQAMLEQSARQAQEAAEQIAREQSQDGQPQQGEPQQGQPEPGDSGQQPGGQQGEQRLGQVRQGQTQGNQPAERNQPGSGENQGQNADSSAAGSGAGQGDPSNISLPGSGGEDQGADTENQTTGQGEIGYEAIYSPVGIEGGGQNEIRLETDAGDATLVEGDFDDNPSGRIAREL